MATTEQATHASPARRWERTPRPEKVAQVNQIRAWMGDSKAQILVDYRGLSVREITDLRKQLRQSGAECGTIDLPTLLGSSTGRAGGC